LLLLALVFGSGPEALVAQMRGEAARIPHVGVNARVGYDIDFDGPVLGVGTMIGLPRVPFSVHAAADVTFLDRINERQLAVDLLFHVGRGLAVGGGPVFRNTIYDVEDGLGPRETRTGYSLVAALGSAAPRFGRLLTGLELRWIWIEDFRPQTIIAQAGLSLFRW
jgi:hypothetical protein